MEEDKAEFLEEDHSKGKLKPQSDAAYDEGRDKQDTEIKRATRTVLAPNWNLRILRQLLIKCTSMALASLTGTPVQGRKAMIELRNLTRWTEEQIEGWKVTGHVEVDGEFFLC